MRVQAGGTYTRHVWRKLNATLTPADDECSAYISQGYAYNINDPATGKTFGTDYFRCTDFNNCSCPPNTPIFKRYIDDVIVMVPVDSGDLTPPGPPANFRVQ